MTDARDAPEESEAPTRERARRARVAATIYAAVTAVMLVMAGGERLGHHTPYDHFALLADAWIHGRLDLGGPPPAYARDNDFARFDGKVFVSFPPFPAVLIAPAVLAAGSAERTRDGLFFTMLSGVAPAFLFLALERLRDGRRARTTERDNIGLAALFAFGTVYFFSAVQGTVWFAAHVVGAGLAAIYAWAAIDASQPVVAGIALGLGLATRTPLAFAFPLFVSEALRLGGGRAAALRRLGAFAAPGAVVVALLAWHNAARFGDPLEFGHRLLAIGWRARIDKWGLFSFHYLGRNLAVALTSLPYTGAQAAPLQVNGHGLALWVTSPFYAWALWPRRPGPCPRSVYWALAATAGLVALPSLLYQNSGWLQFGYRFSNDFAPFLVLMIAAGQRPLRTAFWALGAFAVAVNFFGALSFGRAGYERFYFIDGTQKILHQPD